MKYKIVTTACAFGMCFLSAQAQVNILSSAINFRSPTTANYGQTTYHYGGLQVNGTTSDVLRVANMDASATDKVAVRGISTPQGFYGIGGRFEGGTLEYRDLP